MRFPPGTSLSGRPVRAATLAVGLAVMAAVIAPASARALDAPYDWNGTMTIAASHSGPESGGSASYAGPIEAGFCCGFSYFTPVATSYYGWHQPVEGACRSETRLAPGDVGDTRIPIFIEWGRTPPGGTAAVPRMVASDREWSFPRSGNSCLARNGGAVVSEPLVGDQPTVMSDQLDCTYLPYEPLEMPIAAPFYLPPPLPERVVLGDGSVRFSGSVRVLCDPYAGETAREMTMTIDVTGTPAERPEQVREFPLSVEVRGTQYGSVVAPPIACGQGSSICSAQFLANSRVRLAPLEGEAGLFGMWLGCDEMIARSCFVTMTSARHVYAWFGYDFVGQFEPPPTGLFSLDRKAEIASNGAKAAQDGAVGCALTAGLIGTASGSSVIVVGAGGAATRFQSLVQQLLEETVGNCAAGLAGTIFNGVLLKIDPPDPQWKRIALAERFARARVGRCTAPRGCAALTRARKQYVAADARVLALQEALAVAANRYGNAINNKDLASQGLHQATMRATSGTLAEAYGTRNKAGAGLARAIRGTGVRRIVIPAAAVARANAARAKGKEIPKAAVTRLVRKHLIVSAKEVTPMLTAQTPKRAKSLDVLASLTRPVATAKMQAAGRALTLGDVARIVEAVTRDTGTPPGLRGQLLDAVALALRCDAESAGSLTRLRDQARAAAALNAEGRALIMFAANEVKSHNLATDEACR